VTGLVGLNADLPSIAGWDNAAEAAIDTANKVTNVFIWIKVMLVYIYYNILFKNNDNLC